LQRIRKTARNREESDARFIARVHVESSKTPRFYEKLGGQLILEKSIERSGQALVEVAYGWNDLNTNPLP
jgi:hypothetical protein